MNNKDYSEQIEDLKEELHWIPIINGKGRPLKMKRNEFHQTTYDTLRLKGFWGGMLKFGGGILILLNLLIVILNLIEQVKKL